MSFSIEIDYVGLTELLDTTFNTGYGGGASAHPPSVLTLRGLSVSAPA